MAILAKPQSTGGHWYAKDGTPTHTVLSAKGEPRPTTIRDARKLGLLPSVTGILDVLYSFGLEDWKLEQVALAAARTPKAEGETDAYWVGRVKAAAFAQVDNARDLGSKIHGALEAHEKGEPFDPAMEVYVKPVIDWQAGTGIRFVGVEKVVVNLREGFAGTCDKLFVYGGAGVGALDYKSKKTTPGRKVEAYTNQGMQLAAYIATEFGVDRLDDALAANVFISTTEPGRIEVVKHANLRQLYDTFLHCCAIWRMNKNYDPRQPAS